MKKSLDEYLKIALKVSGEVGDFALKKFGSVKTSFHKAGTEYGIKEDKECNTLYENLLKKLTPEVALFTEEGEQDLESDLIWAIDPIDGTTNYSLGNPFFNTQICLIQNGMPVVGVIFAPALNQKFTAIKDKGALLNNQKIEVSKKTEIERTVFSIGAGNTRQLREWLGAEIATLMKHFRSPRVLSSTGNELAYTASGKIDLFISKGGSLWDYAPGVLMIREAGGVVLNFEGKDWTIKDRELIASNKILVEKTLEIL